MGMAVAMLVTNCVTVVIGLVAGYKIGHKDGVIETLFNRGDWMNLNKSEIQKLTDEELIKHYNTYSRKIKQRLVRYYSLQIAWAKEEIDKRGLKG